MCGICGIAGPLTSQETTQQSLEKMLQHLYLRGPDDQGTYYNTNIAMGMRRLAIIDIEGGQQPIQHTSTGVTIIFNGEIYNYLELRRELEKAGIQFHTHSDTEVILNCYLHYGETFPQYLNGMFAIAIWDPRDQSLILLRDHLGQKPLYISHSEQGLLFSSDLRSLLRHPNAPRELNRHALASYLQLRHIPAPTTIIDGIEQLVPGELLIYQPHQPIQRKQFWQPRFAPDQTLSIEGAIEEFEVIWPQVIKRHLQSEVPIGAFLSGGIDSSLITAEAVKQHSPFHTLSVSFGNRSFDESPYAKQVAAQLGSQHQTLEFKLELEPLLQKWIVAYDQPFADPAALPSLLMCEAAKQHFTVALSGDGGDELFAGYQRYRSTLLARKLCHIPKPMRQAAAKLLQLSSHRFSPQSARYRTLNAAARRLQLIDQDVRQEYEQQFHIISVKQLSQLITDTPLPSKAQQATTPLLHWMMQQDIEGWLPDQMLTKMDRASMASSLELRTPFLDRDVVDFALRLPVGIQYQGGKLKYLLRRVAQKHFPAEISQRGKRGFSVPTDQLLRENSTLVSNIFTSELDRHQGLLDKQEIDRLWQQHRQLKCNHGEVLLAILLFLLWHQHNLIEQ